ncbi:unnamed protein product [Medioppia subpectinata]|uniref:Uncharacterized protein n=1 Tax=Medioppia subpectinata TaxID=1979941 RepID=A0A7R9Q0M0_9ACAR|nr:unnamed protein product [Medioppia subpectinata]CAG2108105.1 unnamed protein product [Medioppia subpectinata]
MRGIFESGDEELVDAFKQAVDRVNNDRTVLARSKLVARIETIKSHDSFHASKLSQDDSSRMNNMVYGIVWPPPSSAPTLWERLEMSGLFESEYIHNQFKTTLTALIDAILGF